MVERIGGESGDVGAPHLLGDPPLALPLLLRVGIVRLWWCKTIFNVKLDTGPEIITSHSNEISREIG